MRAILHIFDVKCYFGSLVLWQILAANNKTTYFNNRPNEVQKLDILGNKVSVHDNDRLYCKLRCNVISLAILTQWHPDLRKYGGKKLQFSGRQERKNHGCSKVPICPPNFPKMKDYQHQNSPKISQSCAKVSLHGKNCAVAQKRESCAKVALRNIAVFWGYVFS